MSLLELRSVGRTFSLAAGGSGTEVLKDVELDVEQGETLSIVGPSGCGKSTLLNLIGGLDRPSTGTIQLAGRQLGELDAKALAEARSSLVGFVFQAHHLLPQCTALENVIVPTLVSKDAAIRSGAEARARELLTRAGLEHRLDHVPAQLSGGESQRVAIVRALINQPRLILADEPTGALDESSADAMAELLIELNRGQDTALIVVTHSRELAARFDRSLSLQSGCLVAAQPS